MNFNIKCIGKLQGLTNGFERSLVFETGEFERPKFDCITYLSVDLAHHEIVCGKVGKGGIKCLAQGHKRSASYEAPSK